MEINRVDFRIKDDNIIKQETEKNNILIGDTCRKGSNHIYRMIYKDYGLSREWNTYTITRNGIIYEHFNPKYYNEFIGDNDLDKKTITVLFENMNMLYNYNDKYYNWINEECNEKDKIYEKLWKNCFFWEKYTTQQYDAFAYLVKYLIENFNIYKNIIKDNLYYEDYKNFNGILTSSNIFKDEVDVNPSFDYDLIISKLKEENIELTKK